MRHRAFRGISWVEIGSAHTLSLLGKELQQHAAGTPTVTWTVSARSQLFGDREPHLGGDLLGAQEIFVSGLFKAAARKGDKALVAIHVSPLIDRHGKMAAAQQMARGRRLVRQAIERGRIELGAGPHLTGAAKIDHQHAYWAFGLGLQNETAVEFERGNEQYGLNDSF